MPIYDFYCDKCKKTEEKWVSIKESENIKCNKCNSKMRKVPPKRMSFDLIYNPKKDKVSWGAEGYATTQRYRETNKKK